MLNGILTGIGFVIGMCIAPFVALLFLGASVLLFGGLLWIIDKLFK